MLVRYAIPFAVLAGACSPSGEAGVPNAAENGHAFIYASDLAVDTAGNSVLEPNETAVMAPTWFNASSGSRTLTGATFDFNGPAGAAYEIPDAAANYGTLGPFSGNSCAATGDCYSVRVTATARPATHWDSTIVETVTGASSPMTWPLHLGASFTDVPTSNPFYPFIEAILHKQVTGGCGGTTYCPSASTTREQMAVFVLVAKEGSGYLPPACGTPVFVDVPASSPFCPWIEELARRTVVAGCGGGNYCPSSPVTREEMAVFVLRTRYAAIDPPACGVPMYDDVAASSPFCRWVEELTRRGVVSGCGGGDYCPAAAVTREQMAVFLSAGFRLRLYGY
jgi:hypothetical protein